MQAAPRSSEMLARWTDRAAGKRSPSAIRAPQRTMATVNGIKAAAKSTGDSAYRPLGTVSVADGDAESEIARDALLEAHALGDSGTEDTRQLLLVTLIASVGTILEWFDFACFGYFASTFSQLFFPAEDKVASLAATFGVFAGAFVMRPVGGVLFGYVCPCYPRVRARACS